MDDKIKEKKGEAEKEQKPLSRRDFLKATASTGLGLAIAGGKLFGGPLIINDRGQGQAVFPSEELRVALIGAGEQGRILLQVK
ncbi:MAG: twin-arginine translocation signal domain-containing protein [Candidatus Saccharicenans sp.]|uniref:twin-arginine translocation signal domain-containing protein n=1 Tax=Candidatus Saccharicenans sp. TaxID=2819258 RepID=UPI00404A3F04